jgi:hypothetical protein
MTRMQLSRWQLPFPTAMAPVLLGGIFTACCPKPPAPPQPAAACPRGVAPSTRAQLDACLQGLTFDSDSAVSDSQPLTVINGTAPAAPCPGDKRKTCRFGPLAKIEPVKGAQNYRDDDLRQGRIIARLSIPSGETEGYPKYGLQPGKTTYWWVRTDESGARGQSMFITTTKAGEIEPKPVPRPLYRYVYEKGEELARAIARWIWSLDDEKAEGGCGGGTCR